MTDSATTAHAANDRRLQIWDWPVRLFHWLIVILIAVSWYTGEEGMMDIHQWSGLAVLALTLTRVIWGFVGSSTTRFSSFVRGPRAVWGYVSNIMRREPAHVAGHTPTGAWMILAFYLLLIAMPVLGLFANDDIFFRGPLAYRVDKELSDSLTVLHKQLFDLLLIFVILHVAAVLIYRLVLKEDLVTPMITGRRSWPGPDYPQLRMTSGIWAVAIFAVVSALIYLVIL